MYKNYSKAYETNRKVDEVILRYSQVACGELMRAAEKLTYDPEDFLETNGFTEDETRELLPSAKLIRKELFREFKSSHPYFTMNDTPKGYFPASFYEAAEQDTFLVERLYKQIKFYFSDVNHQNPADVTALLRSELPNKRFGGFMALKFPCYKANFLAKNFTLCKEIAAVIEKQASTFEVTEELNLPTKQLTYDATALPEDIPQEAATNEERVDKDICQQTTKKQEEKSCNATAPTAEATSVQEENSGSKFALQQKILLHPELSIGFLKAFKQMSEQFTKEEILHIISNEKIQVFIGLCSEM